MNTLTTRAYVGEQDLVPIVDLLNACEAIDKLDEGTSVEELQAEFTAPGLDLERDIRLWHASDGQVR